MRADTAVKDAMPRASQGELLQGTLPLLILRTLSTGPNHGFAIARRIQQISKAVLRVEQGSLYPALHRMELDGLILSYWGTTENNRRAKYYRLTPRGHKALAKETSRWNAIAGAVVGDPAGELVPVWLSRFWLRLRSTLHPQHHQELSEELQLHLRLLEEEYVAQGLTPAEARDRARREFGNPTLLQEDSHDLFSFRAVENLAQDVRHAMGEMRRASSFIALAVALLALGIGAATAAFAIVDAVMFRPLPVRAPSGLVAVTSGDGAEWSRWPYAAFVRWRQGATGLAEIAASSDVMSVDAAADRAGRSLEVRVSLVSDNYFRTLGADVVLGRALMAADASGDADGAVAVISDAFWRRWFAASPDVLHRTD